MGNGAALRRQCSRPSSTLHSGGCQFFITTNSMREWNGKYTIFGMVVDGQDVVSKINEAKVHDDKPVEPVKLINVTIERIGPEPMKKPKK
jgi:cyclophilin family peptidyl-prolyl cis-trans isomerase